MQPASDCRMSGLVSFGPGVQCPCASPGSRYVNCSVAIVLAEYVSVNRHSKTIGFCSDSSGRGGSRPARAGKRAWSTSVMGKWTSTWTFLRICFCGHPMSRPQASQRGGLRREVQAAEGGLEPLFRWIFLCVLVLRGRACYCASFSAGRRQL